MLLPERYWAKQGNDLSALDAKVEPAESHRLNRPRPEQLEHIVELERRPLQLVGRSHRLPVEALYRHRKLWLIIRNASTLSTPFGAPRSTIARLPLLDR